MDFARAQNSLETGASGGAGFSAKFIRALVPVLIVLAIAIVMHRLIGPWAGNYSTKIILDTGVAIILAVSLNIVNGYTGQFSIGHAAFMTIGGYIAAFITYYTSLRMWGDSLPRLGIFGPQEWMLAVAALLGGGGAAAAGWLVGLPSLRLRGDYLAIVTLGFGEIVRVLLQQTNRQIFSLDELKHTSMIDLHFPPAVGGAQGFSDIPKLTNLFWMYLFVGLTILFAYRLKQSSYGRALLSIREDEIAAEAMGINVTKLKVRAFVFAAFFAGIAGALYAHQNGTLLRPTDAGFQHSFDIVIMVVLGGLGSLSGAVMAAILLTGIQLGLLEAQGWIQEHWHISVIEYRMPVFALLLILTMIFRPKGLFGVREIWDFFGRKSGQQSPAGNR